MLRMSDTSNSDSSDDSRNDICKKTDRIRSTRKRLSREHGHQTRKCSRSNDDPSSESDDYKQKRNKVNQNIMKTSIISKENTEVHVISSSLSQSSSNIQTGPVLPPHFAKFNDEAESANMSCRSVVNTQETENHSLLQNEDKDKSTFGPALPPHLSKKNQNDPSLEAATVGPMVPHHLVKSKYSEVNITEKTPLHMGPILPPHLMMKEAVKNVPKVIGPTLPPHLQKQFQEEVDQENLQEEKPDDKVIGPTLPSHLRQNLAEATNDSEEDDSFGPLPPGATLSKSHLELEERAWQLKIDQLNPQQDDEPKREDWMLELPAVKAANLGLGPRNFRMKGGPDLSDR